MVVDLVEGDLPPVFGPGVPLRLHPGIAESGAPALLLHQQEQVRGGGEGPQDEGVEDIEGYDLDILARRVHDCGMHNTLKNVMQVGSWISFPEHLLPGLPGCVPPHGCLVLLDEGGGGLLDFALQEGDPHGAGYRFEPAPFGDEPFVADAVEHLADPVEMGGVHVEGGGLDVACGPGRYAVEGAPPELQVGRGGMVDEIQPVPESIDVLKLDRPPLAIALSAQGEDVVGAPQEVPHAVDHLLAAFVAVRGGLYAHIVADPVDVPFGDAAGA